MAKELRTRFARRPVGRARPCSIKEYLNTTNEPVVGDGWGGESGRRRHVVFLFTPENIVSQTV